MESESHAPRLRTPPPLVSNSSQLRLPRPLPQPRSRHPPPPPHRCGPPTACQVAGRLKSARVLTGWQCVVAPSAVRLAPVAAHGAWGSPVLHMRNKQTTPSFTTPSSSKHYHEREATSLSLSLSPALLVATAEHPRRLRASGSPGCPGRSLVVAVVPDATPPPTNRAQSAKIASQISGEAKQYVRQMTKAEGKAAKETKSEHASAQPVPAAPRTGVPACSSPEAFRVTARVVPGGDIREGRCVLGVDARCTRETHM